MLHLCCSLSTSVRWGRRVGVSDVEYYCFCSSALQVLRTPLFRPTDNPQPTMKQPIVVASTFVLVPRFHFFSTASCSASVGGAERNGSSGGDVHLWRCHLLSGHHPRQQHLYQRQLQDRRLQLDRRLYVFL